MLIDPRSEYVASLHRAYSQRRLNVLVGAGIAQQSGFPGWDQFNKALLRNYLAKDIGVDTPAGMLASAGIEQITEDLYHTLGRDAAADFIDHASAEAFGSALAEALYEKRDVKDLPLKSVHHQIVSLLPAAKLFTLNLDPLLELALTRNFPRRNWLEFRSPDANGVTLRGQYRVEHLHGWVDPDGKISDEVVLTQSKYFDLSADPNAPANRWLRKILAGDNTTLILGMSLADPNFRRVLYFLNKESAAARRRIFVIMRRDKPAVDHYMQVHWGGNGLRLLFIEDYEEIPGLLRDIQWGEAGMGEIPNWIEEAIAWRLETLPDSVIFDDLWQRIAHESLSTLTERVRRLFALSAEEEINVALFIPFWDKANAARLRMVAASRKNVGKKGASYRAVRRVLSIQRGGEQGIAGASYLSGTIRSVAFGEGQVDINFTPEMRSDWISDLGYRDWRSIVAVPVLDSKSWVPVGVITVTSNLPDPFWTRFGDKKYLLEPELHAAMRQAAYFCLAGFGAADG